jgi:hypothetical protein
MKKRTALRKNMNDFTENFAAASVNQNGLAGSVMRDQEIQSPFSQVDTSDMSGPLIFAQALTPVFFPPAHGRQQFIDFQRIRASGFDNNHAT